MTAPENSQSETLEFTQVRDKRRNCGARAQKNWSEKVTFLHTAAFIRTAVGIISAALLAGAALYLPALAIGLSSFFAIMIILGWPGLQGLTDKKRAQLSLALIALAGAGSAIFKDIRWLAMLAGFSLLIAFIFEMLRQKDQLRRIEQIAGNYCGMLLLICGFFWIPNVVTDFASQISLIFAAVIAVGSLLSIFATRSAFAVSLINGIFVGGAVAWLNDTDLAVGLLAGIAVPLLYWFTQAAFVQVKEEKRILVLGAYSVLPLVALGFLATLTALVLR